MSGDLNKRIEEHLSGEVTHDVFYLLRDAYAKILVLEEENQFLKVKARDLQWAVDFYSQQAYEDRK